MLGVDDVHEAAHERQKHAQLVTDQVPRVDDRQGDRDQAEEDHAAISIQPVRSVGSVGSVGVIGGHVSRASTCVVSGRS